MKALLIESVRVIEPLKLEITWRDGVALTLDFDPLLKTAKPAAPIHALASGAVFAGVTVDEWGHGLDWPDSAGWCMDADTLRELAVEQAGLPTPSQFAAWMARNRLSLTGAADVLGMTRRMITHYKTGSRLIPKVVGLACKGWEAEQAGH